MGKFGDALRKMNESFNYRGARSADAKIPEGEYTMQLQECFLKESQAGNLMVRRVHRVVEGEFEGFPVYDNINLGNEFGPGFLKAFIEKMGAECPEDEEQIEDVLQEIQDRHPAYTARVMHSKSSDFINVRIGRLLETETALAESTEPDAAATPAATAPAVKLPAKPAPAAAAPVVEEAPTEEAPTEEAPTYNEGDAVSFTDEGVEKSGLYRGPGEEAGTSLVEDSEGNLYAVSTEELKAAGQEEVPVEDVERIALLSFCQARDIECAEDEEKDSLLAKVRKGTYLQSELTDEELALLKSFKVVIKSAPPKPIVKPIVKPVTKPAPAPVKPVVKPPAKPAPKPAPKPAKKK